MEDKQRQELLGVFGEHRHSKRRRIFIIISATVGAVSAAVLIAYILTPKSPPSAPAAAPIVIDEDKPLPIPEPVFYSPLTGLKVKDEAAVKRQTTAIMIENSPESRPQSGMHDAGVTYEAVAEGGITRFLTVYQEKLPKLIGPVRSLRPYYVSWLAPYDPAVAHVGGSAAALKEVRNGKYKDIDQFFNPGAYYRSSDRYAPHNVYTTADRLNKLNKDKGFTAATFDAWPRKVDAPSTKPNAKTINVAISGPTYNSRYTYDAKTNSYKRFQDGKPHVDREAKKPLNPKVVIVMKVKQEAGFEDGYREQITTTGKGEALIFQDGTALKVTWSKKDKRAPIKFTKDNEEVLINAGRVWITAIDSSGASVTYK